MKAIFSSVTAWLTLAAVIFATAVLLATSMMVSNAREERRLNSEALDKANGQMSELRAACTRRIDTLTADLKKERGEQ